MIMEYKHEYKILEGNKEFFEKKMNETDDSWVWCGNMNTMPTREGMHYSILICKTTKVNE